MKLLCQRCGIRGSADLAFIWYAKTFEPKQGGPRRETTLWLCPDCRLDFESNRERAAFLETKLKEKSKK
jgi:hypothetical protein